MENPSKIYQVRPAFAQRNNMLIYFVAKAVIETNRALYLYGHGTTETVKLGVCCKCGRVLTHPVSVELGIGPECGKHFHDWDLIGGYSKENLERLKGALVDIKVEGWFPKSQIVKIMDTEELITVPPEHPMLKPRENEMAQGKFASMAVNKHGDRVIMVKFPYDAALVDKVRNLAGRMYHSQDKCWSAPVYLETLTKLIEWGFSLDDKLKAFMNNTTIKTKEIVGVGVPGLKGTLFEFQAKGVSFIEHNKGRALIADEMGLGKTIQALAWLQLHPEVRPAIIVCPASVKLNWRREAITWMNNPKVEILSGTTPSIKTKADIFIINYDILADWIESLKSLEPRVIITDECHYYKSNQTKRTKAVKMLAKGIPHVIALSGTPIVNRPIEMFNAIKMISPELFPDAWAYARRYCNARHNGYGWDFNGSSNSEELHQILTDSIMIRRLKVDVLKDLPDKLKSFVPMSLTNQSEYDKAEADFIQFIKDTKGADAAKKASNAQAFAEIEGLKQLAVRGKLKQVIDWINEFMEVDTKLVVFATHKFVIDEIMQAFPKISVKVDGSVTMTERQQSVDLFQNNPDIKLFVGNIKAAGIGITLTAASNVAFVELPWTPGDLVQAEDRCHRIGQKDSVTIHYLLADGTIENKIATLLDSKRKVLDAVLDGVETSQESLLSELIKSYMK